MRLFPPSRVQIDVHPLMVTFRTTDLTFAAEPMLHLRASRGRVLDSLLGIRVSGVGAIRPDGTAHTVRVLDRAAALPARLSREGCLVLFFRHGLAHVMNQYAFRARPNVEVTGVQTLYATVGADTRELLERALRKGGANRVALLDGLSPRPFAA